MGNPASGDAPGKQKLLASLAAVTFFIFFQAFMIAPILPQIGLSLAVSPHRAALIIPAYLLPYGIATLIHGMLADRFGLWRVIATSLISFSLLTLLTPMAQSIDTLILVRLLTGLGASGVVPMALVLVGRLFPYEQRGRPLGWLFGAMAGGMAFGSTLGAFLQPWIGWRGLFLLVGICGFCCFAVLAGQRSRIDSSVTNQDVDIRSFLRGYRALLASPRGLRTYGYVLLNSIFHSGTFTWLGLYFEQHFGLGPRGVGLALLGYGVPGFLFGPLIGRLTDRHGRAKLIPLGLLIGAIGAGGLALSPSIPVAAILVTLLSIGYDMTQPLFGGIVTTLGGSRPGQAMGLNVCMLFSGFGFGSILFGAILRFGYPVAFLAFAAAELTLAWTAVRAFRTEKPAPMRRVV